MFEPLVDQKMTVAVKGLTFPIEGKGEIKLHFGQGLLTLTNVMFSTQLRRNLISGPQLDKHGVTFIGKQGDVKMS